jgi:tape measure domain-containing protein
MSIAREEFRQSTQGLDRVRDAMQYAQARAQMLSTQIASQTQIVERLRQAHQEAVQQFGAGSRQATQYELELRRAESTLQRLERELQQTNQILNRTGMSVSEAAERFRALGITFESIGAKFQQIGRTLSVAITAPLVAGATAGLNFSKNMEESTNAFTTMLGSADKAKNMVSDLTEFAKKTPFEMQGLSKAATTLLNFGVNSRDVMPNLKMLGDISQGSQEKLDRLSLEFGQIAAKGRLTGDNLNQLIESGFNPLKVIFDKTGESMTSLQKRMENGKLSFDEMLTAFKYATSEGGLFFNSMENASKTFNGQLSTLKDSVNITLGGIMKPLFDDLSKNIMPKLIAGVDKLANYFKSLGESEQLAILKTAAIAAALGPVLVAIGGLVAIIPTLVTGVQALGVAFSFLVANPIILGLAGLAAGIGLLVYMSGNATREIKKMTNALIDNYKKQAEIEKKTIDDTYKTKLDYIDNQMVSETKAFETKRDLLQKEYEEEVKTASKKEQATKKSLQERKSLLEESHKEAIQRIRDEYGVFEEKEKSKTDIVNKRAEDSKKAKDEELEKAKETAKKEEKAFKEAIDAAIKNAKDFQDAIEKAWEKTNKAAKDALQKDTDEKEKIYKKDVKAAEDANKTKVKDAEDAAKRQIKAEEDIIKTKGKAYEKDVKDAQEAHDKKIKLLDEEYEKTLMLKDEDLAKKVKALNLEIDSINAKTEEEDRIAKDKSDAEKVEELKKKINAAKTIEDRINAEQELGEEIARINRDKELERRKTQIDSLKTQIDNLKETHEKEKDELRKKLDSDKEQENSALKTLKQNLKDSYDAFVEKQRDKITTLTENLKTEKEKLDTALEEEKGRLSTALDSFKTAQQEKADKLDADLVLQKEKLDKLVTDEINRNKTSLDEYQTNEENKLAALVVRINTEKEEIDKKAKAEIAVIQDERKEKEKEENNKYKAAKSALDSEEQALDGFAEIYKGKLAAQLAEKQKIEKEKYDATVQRLADEKKLVDENIAAEKKKVDEQQRINVETAKLKTLETQLAKTEATLANGSWLDKIELALFGENKNHLKTQIKNEKLRLHNIGIPGFAGGVNNWRGGLARINEHGGEIVNLPSGANVIPHDISMQIANAVGQAIGGNQNISVNLILDGKVLATVTSKIQAQSNLSRSRAMGVVPT